MAESGGASERLCCGETADYVSASTAKQKAASGSQQKSITSFRERTLGATAGPLRAQSTRTICNPCMPSAISAKRSRIQVANGFRDRQRPNSRGRRLGWMATLFRIMHLGRGVG